MDTHQRAIQSGERHHGCSIHVVTAELDAGAVLTQALTEIKPHEMADSLQARVQKLEHQLLPWTILLLAKGALSMNSVQASQQENRFLPLLPLKLYIRD